MSSTFDVENLFSPVPFDLFLTEYFGQKVCHSPGNRSRFLPLLDWSGLNEILTYHRWQYPRFRLAQDGRDLPEGVYSSAGPSGTDYAALSYRDIVMHLRRGASLVVDALDEIWPPVRRLAVSLERVLGEYVKVNAYASWTQEPGFDEHWDDHDVIVLQITGSKRWVLLGEARTAPVRNDVDPNSEPPSGPREELIVRPGDVLHIPRGHWHSVNTVEGPSLHLTLGITQRTGLDYLRWLADHLTEDEVMRRSLPRYSAEALALHAAGVSKIITEAMQGNAAMQTFLDQAQGHGHVRQQFQLPVTARADMANSLGDAPVVWLPSRFTLRHTDHDVIVELNGRRWRFDPDAGAALGRLSEGLPIHIDDLARHAGRDRDWVRYLAADLILEGLVAVVESSGDRNDD